MAGAWIGSPYFQVRLSVEKMKHFKKISLNHVPVLCIDYSLMAVGGVLGVGRQWFGIVAELFVMYACDCIEI